MSELPLAEARHGFVKGRITLAFTMAVKVWLTSGVVRVFDEADGAALDGYFIRITSPERRAGSDHGRVLVTLRAQDVSRVEIETDGVISELLPGRFSDG